MRRHEPDLKRDRTRTEGTWSESALFESFGHGSSGRFCRFRLARAIRAVGTPAFQLGYELRAKPSWGLGYEVRAKPSCNNRSRPSGFQSMPEVPSNQLSAGSHTPTQGLLRAGILAETRVRVTRAYTKIAGIPETAPFGLRRQHKPGQRHLVMLIPVRVRPLLLLSLLPSLRGGGKGNLSIPAPGCNWEPHRNSRTDCGRPTQAQVQNPEARQDRPGRRRPCQH